MKQKHAGMRRIPVSSAEAASKLRGYVEMHGTPEQLQRVDRIARKGGSCKLWLRVPDEVAKTEIDAYLTAFGHTADTTDSGANNAGQLPIEELELTVRAYNCLKREGINTVGDLTKRTEDDLLDIRNFGQRSLDELKAKLAGLGVTLTTA